MSEILEETTIHMYEGNDPLITLWVESVAPDGTVTDFDFTGADEVQFVVKETRDTPDASAWAVYTVAGGQVTVLDPPSGGRVTVQATGADMPKTGVFRYRLDVVKNGHTQTVMIGPFAVENV